MSEYRVKEPWSATTGKLRDGKYMAEIIVSFHAKEECQRRGIAMEILISLINNPQQVLNEKERRKAYQSKIEFDGRIYLVRAIVAEIVDKRIVVTVYRTSRIEKYWRPS